MPFGKDTTAPSGTPFPANSLFNSPSANSEADFDLSVPLVLCDNTVCPAVVSVALFVAISRTFFKA
ncbi:hypothetical protein BVZ46_01165 [Haemophilus influenzae]|nr:hypothetical protein BVZ47_01364 [Haemophilus influenzae]PRI27659.1 hypothetical protein BVZ46_01165 [Haemophilus influenzae]PRJ01723.1 hypothetical protein BV032_01762 [Haemophilus influenzae]PRJ99234.1 hypothetical protein BV178_01253 [Haemophilus influenzae]PRK01634.1 hypothetical protein BV179_00314 [Haemophilus influenzae]